jgi:alkylation response protein AidB-like acyl-CoA dehydrogenase
LAQLRLGEAEGLLRSARAYLYEVVAEVESATGLGPEQIDELGASVRLASAYAVQNATRAVDLMFDAAGGSSVYASSRLERCFRDVHMVSHHAIVSPSNIELVGQYLLGLGLRMRR